MSSEPVGGYGWLALLLGFGGVAVILQPGAEAFTPWALLPVLGGFFYALANVTTRIRCRAVPVAALALSLNLALLTIGVAMSALVFAWQPDVERIGGYAFVFSGWSALGIHEWGVIALLAVLVVAIGASLAGAYQAAPAPTVATFDYGYLIFVVAWDYWFFSIEPSGSTILGVTLIVVAGLMVARGR